MQRFLDHTKATRKQMGVSQSVPVEPEQTQVTSMASPEVVDADKVPAPQDPSQGFQYSVQWEADRDALSRRVAALAAAGILASGAFKQFLQKTPLPDRGNSEDLSQARFDVEQLAFNAKLQSWVDSQTPGVSQAESNMDDALRLSVSESGSGGTGEMTEAEMSSEAEHASDPDRSRASIESQSTPLNQQDQSASADQGLVTVQPASTGNQDNTMDVSQGQQSSKVAEDLTATKTLEESSSAKADGMVTNQVSLYNAALPVASTTEPKVQDPVPASVDPSKDVTSPSQAPTTTSTAATPAVPVTAHQVSSQDKSGDLPASGITSLHTDTAPIPMDEEPDHQGCHEVAMTVEEILKRGIVADPHWMKVRTLVLRVSRQKAYFQITLDQIMTDLEGLGISHGELIGIGESGTGEWEVYCCTRLNVSTILADSIMPEYTPQKCIC